MKYFFLVIIILSLSFTLSITAADVVDNPAQPVTPQAKKIDRIVKLKEVFRISDIGKNFFLKRPERIRVARDGSVFLMDRAQLHIMRFDARGKFLTRMLKKGEGPGELVNLMSYWLGDKEVIGCGYMPVKVVGMDHQGKLIKEFNVKTNEFLFNFMGRYNNKYYFYIDPLESGDGLKVSQIPLVFADEKGALTKTGLTLPVTRVMYTARVDRRGSKGKSELRIMREKAEITRFNYVFSGGRYLYLSTDERYVIHRYDIEKDRIDLKFRRPYTPVSFTPNPGNEFVNSPEFKALYKWEHYADVYRLLADGDRVWAITSTIDKTKGVLVDVFDARGTYIDRFYLQIPGLKYPDDRIMHEIYHHKGFLYTIEFDEEDTPNIVKYKLNTHRK